MQFIWHVFVYVQFSEGRTPIGEMKLFKKSLTIEAIPRVGDNIEIGSVRSTIEKVCLNLSHAPVYEILLEDTTLDFPDDSRMKQKYSLMLNTHKWEEMDSLDDSPFVK